MSVTESSNIAAKPAAGVAPSQHIRALIAEGAIRAAAPVTAAQIQPASLDLRLGRRAWRLRASFLPGAGAQVAARLPDFAMHAFDLTDSGAVLEAGCVYLVELQESLALPADMSAAANAKSSTGRLDVFTRLITNGAAAFDRVEAGYVGPLFAEISPRTFSVLARPGGRLNQIRFRCGAARLSDHELADLHGRGALVDGPAAIDDGLVFSVDLAPRDGPAGYKARRHAPLIDLDQINAYAPTEFWEPLDAGLHGRLILDPGAFYILASRESVTVPINTAAEMSPYSAMIGEFRVHYAGFFDPGFGAASQGGPARGVLEVRCHEAPFALEHGQPAGRLIYERMLDTPDLLYGPALGSNYAGQGLRLSKHFRV